MFNGLISLGRAGLNASFISETGDDRVGKRIISFMEQNHVDTSNISVYPEAKSPISLAFLIVMFGSFYAINPVIRPQMQAFLEYAHQKGAILYYDVNYRASHKNEVVKVTANILENFELADIIRGSSEDFEVMFNKTDADSVYRAQIDFYCKNFIYTHGGAPIEFRAKGGLAKQYAVPATKTVSTIGAGDNFNAGFVYGLIKYGVTRDMLEEGVAEDVWDAVISEANQFAANVCSSINNSVDEAFGEKKHQELEMALKEMEENK